MLTLQRLSYAAGTEQEREETLLPCTYLNTPPEFAPKSIWASENARISRRRFLTEPPHSGRRLVERQLPRGEERVNAVRLACCYPEAGVGQCCPMELDERFASARGPRRRRRCATHRRTRCDVRAQRKGRRRCARRFEERVASSSLANRIERREPRPVAATRPTEARSVGRAALPKGTG
jgi:hypothetical protein